MRKSEIEHWAIQTLDRLAAGEPIEDSAIELKRCWVDPAKAARRIAGHANAARGEPILWLIGADEAAGVQGASQTEFADWWAQIQSHFDGLAPRVTDLNVPYQGSSVVALCMETDRAPFVVRNPDYGSVKGGSIQREVPWREGTAIRSALREDLLRILVPLERMPAVEVLGGRVYLRKTPAAGNPFEARINLVLYVVPRSDVPLVFPFHQCSFRVTGLTPAQDEDFEDFTINAHAKGNREQDSVSATVHSTASEVIISGPGRVVVQAAKLLGRELPESQPEVSAIVELRAADSRRPLTVACRYVAGKEFEYLLEDAETPTP